MSSPQLPSNWVSRYADWLIRYRWLVAIGALLLAFFAVSGARFLGFNNDYRAFFSEANPQLQAYEQIQRTYTKNDNILFAVVPKDGNAFSNDALAAVEEMTEKSWLLPYALRVDSITNFQHTIAEEDDLLVQDLVENASNLDAETLASIKAVALADPTLKERLVNSDGSVTGINITFQLPQKSMHETPEAAEAAQALMEEIEEKYDVEVYATGIILLSNAFFEASQSDMSTLVPLMYLVIIAVVFLLVRSFSATFAALLVIVFSMAAGMGLAGFIGVKLTPPSASAPTIIMTLAVADSIHILVSLFAAMRRGLSKHDAIKESLQLNMGPVFLTSITTAIGFLSMNFSDAPPFHDLGNITAMGVMVAFFLSVTLLPALMAILPAKSRASESKIGRSMDTLGDFVIRRQRPILLAGVIVSLGLLAMIPNNEINDDFVGYFDESVEFRTDSDYINDNLSGIYQLIYSIESGDNNGVSNPEFLANLERFTEWMQAQPGVRHVNTIGDTFKRLNKNLHADDPAYYRLPEEQELAAQYLLLYELSLPYGLDLNNQLNVAKSSTQIIVTLDNLKSKELKVVADAGSNWLEKNIGVTAYGVGPAIMFANIAERNMEGMLVGTLVALVLISALIGIALRSVKLGFLSLIPNLLPAGLAFGLWGALVAEVNVAVTMVTGMALGIVVDDTVHFLSKYLRQRRAGYNVEDGLRYAFSSVGVAIVVTSVILIAGFMVLAQSSFGMNSSMALLTAICILMALLADFLLLPILLMKLDAKAYDPAITPIENKEQNYATQPL
ncbi:RND family transporter [Microbulbifer sp. DLAB2-AF]|uniref:efflux RND transporter permease subunit n=1 Tax=unclassified Microbulbifer TaxID=2619833 RepID=UPI00403A85D0